MARALHAAQSFYFLYNLGTNEHWPIFGILNLLHVWQPFEADQTRGCLVKLHGISVLMNEPSAPLCQDLQARRLNSSLVVVGLSLVGRAQPGEL